jgi:CRISPR/Cas system-associated exonuclease Cas4 (RecB family)
MSAGFALDHLSHSQVQSYVMCPRKWRFEKVEAAPRERVGSALIFGIALHDACAAANEATLTGEPYHPATGFVTAWKLAIEDAGVPVHFGKDDADDLLAKGRALAAAYIPPRGIIGVEQDVVVELAPDLPPVHGRIDLIRRTETGDLAIADLKTSSSRLLTETDGVEAQLALYNEAYPATRFEAVVLGKQKVPTVTIQPITPWPRPRLVQHYREVYHAMKAGVRYAVRGWQCDSCPFGDRCRKEG